MSAENISERISIALNFQQNNNLEKAKKLYESILLIKPHHSFALALLGTIFIQESDFKKAILYLKKATLIDPKNAFAFCNLGVAEFKLKRYESSLKKLEKSISLQVNYAEAYYYYGIVLQELGRYVEAINRFECCNKYNPLFIDAYIRQGDIFCKLNQNLSAIDVYKKASNIEPKLITPLMKIGKSFYNLNDFQNARKNFTKILEIDSQNKLALYNIALTYQKTNDFFNASKFYNRVLNLDINDIDTLNNQGLILQHQGNFRDAEKIYSNILLIDKENTFASLNIGIINLYQKKFQDGWHLYENRWQASEKAKYLKTSVPELTDFSVVNKTIFIWAEQGIGDQILFSSLLYDAFRTQNHFYVALEPRLINLFKRSFSHLDHVTFISIHERLAESKYDFHLPIGSLGKFFRNSIEDFNSHPKAYLKTDEIQVSTLRNKIKKNPQKICGISWMSQNAEIGKEKSLSLTELLPILSIPNITFINLQYGETKKEINSILNQHGIEIYTIDEIDNFNDLDGLASLINACDYIVTSSNVTAHIAGALNKETYLLIPYAHGRIWYWGESENKSLWYPSIKIYRCTENGLWSHPIEIITSKFKDIKT